jgi:Mn-dependent DtxR family transcriptional regulator
MADVQNNFETNLEAKLLQLAETLNLSRAEVDEMIEKLISTVKVHGSFSSLFEI